jgi:succinate dehydrogenase / fumarate reductase membrane anchor subunit
MSAADLKTPLKRARGLGSAKSGTHHFIVQRVTAIALVPLVIWGIFLVLALVQADYAQARAIVHHSFAAIWLAALVIATFWHAQLGLQVVIEDYVHTRWLEVCAQLAVQFFCAAGALACLFAIVRIALG